jgi:hypothetical protein
MLSIEKERNHEPLIIQRSCDTNRYLSCYGVLHLACVMLGFYKYRPLILCRLSPCGSELLLSRFLLQFTHSSYCYLFSWFFRPEFQLLSTAMDLEFSSVVMDGGSYMEEDADNMSTMIVIVMTLLLLSGILITFLSPNY